MEQRTLVQDRKEEWAEEGQRTVKVGLVLEKEGLGQ